MRKNVKIGVWLVLLFILTSTFSYGQKMTIRLADKAYHEFSWKEAIELYLYAYEKDSTNIYLVRQLATCYRNNMETEKVEYYLKKIIDVNQQNPEDLYNYSMALKSNGKYAESEKALLEFADMRPGDGRIDREQSILEYIQFLQADSVRYRVESLPFNTKGSDWGPVMYENKIVYVSSGDPDDNRGIVYNWDGLPFLDIYYTDIDEYGNYSKPQVLKGDVNSSFHDGPATFDMVNNRMYFTSNRTKKNQKRREEQNNLQIFYADFENGEWVEKGEFRYNNPLFNVMHPSIDSKGEILYFSSDGYGTKGGADIFWCRKVNGEWSQPINLEEINTEGEERFPFIAPDGVLYFSSDGLGGMGGLDIYQAIPDRGVFKDPENMGYPVNTANDDFGIVLDEVGMSGYFSSDRPGGLGYDDIYKVEILYIPVQITGVVRDRINTYEISGVKIALLDENMDTVDIAYSKEDGEFIFNAYKQRNYRLAVSKQDYIPTEKDVSTYNKLPNEKIEVSIFIEMDFDLLEEPDALEPLSMEMVEGNELQIIQIEHINYGFDSDKILSESANILNKIVELVNQYPDLEVRIESHTDSKGADEYNLRLSKERAVSAYNFLVKKGIDPLMIEYHGFGETQLLNHCEDGVECSDEEHAINRRSIIKVVRRGEYKTKRSTRSIFYF